MERVSYGVIGSGFMGGVLARTASQLRTARCVGAADTDLGRAQALAQALGCKAYTSYEQMLAREQPDAVLIATPEDSHCQPALAAAGHKCHIFMEKPLATSLADADRILEACNHHRVKLMMGHVLRFEINYAMIESAIREGEIGRFLSAYARRVTPISEARRLGGRVSPVTRTAASR